MWMNFFMILISATALFTLRVMRSPFRSIEKAVYYMVIVVAIQQIHSAVPDNLKLIKFSQSFAAFAFFKMNQLVLVPVAGLWLLYFFYKPGIPFYLKTFLCGAWVSV